MPQSLIGAIVDASRTRKDFVADEVIQRVMDLVYAGVRRPLKRAKAKGIPVLVYEPTMADGEFYGSEVTHDLESFKERADVIVVNR